jgi:hypothetical protein
MNRTWNASRAVLTELFDGGASIRYEWDDGAFDTWWFDSHAEARASLRQDGFLA